MTQRLLLSFFMPMCLLGGCSQRVRLPLCHAVAQKSLAPGVPVPADMVVNAYLKDEAAKREIQINVLSPVAAELSGRKGRVHRIEQNYPLLLCAFFDPSAPVEYSQIYTSCVQSTPDWIQIVQSQKPEDLLLPKTHYASVCVK
jgi:hypothetical protein